MKDLFAEVIRSAAAIAVLAVILCGVYPFVSWVAAQGLMPGRANGSLIVRGRTVAGSSLIGQDFRSPAYFHPRPSASGYDGDASGGTNLGPLSKKLIEAVEGRVAAYREENGLDAGSLVPADAVTASASGLDPHISPENARLQAKRVARVRGLAEAGVLARIKAMTEGRTLGILGEPRVNVVLLNLALDGERDVGR